jgi:RimJ/RimL family protein N-acetyltransferase
VGTAIRLGLSRDVDALLALMEAVADERLYIGTEPGFDRAAYRRRFEELVAHPEIQPVFVAVCDGRVVGQLSIFRHAEYGHVVGMLVAAEHRGRGLGRALLDAGIAWAHRHGVGELSLLVFPHNERALALNRSAGFVEIERFERDVTRQGGEVWDTMLMRKTIDPGPAA